MGDESSIAYHIRQYADVYTSKQKSLFFIFKHGLM